MAAWTQSHFLQALGWATLNSLWQMALLWALFSGINHAIKLSPSRKYQLSVGAMLIGFAWAINTFVFYYQNHSSSYAFFENTVVHSNRLLHICLLAASLTYLLLLIFPAIRLYKNWRFVQLIKKEGHRKAKLEHRLFIQKVVFLLGVTKKVKVVISSLVASPVTVGYLKPIILLPVAAMNNLTTAQVEAILLHELSHIRRYDYLLNVVVSVIHSLLYFNPFVKSFMQIIEAEREACCDELVLQFGYDKVSYASALVHLEKSSGRHHALALPAAGKQNLLTRIEKIVGMEKKRPFKLVQIIPLVLAMFCVLLFNSVLIIKDAKRGEAISYASNTVLNPWEYNNHPGSSRTSSPQNSELPLVKNVQKPAANNPVKVEIYNISPAEELEPDPVTPAKEGVAAVNFDEVDGRLTTEQKENVEKTVEATKKIAKTLQWKTIEASIGDALSTREKAMAKLEYLKELDGIHWNNIKQNLKANYENLNWDAINLNIKQAIRQVELDSVQTVYTRALCEIEKTQRDLAIKSKCASTPLPDASIKELQLAKEVLRKNLDTLKMATSPKKIIRL